MAPAHEPGEVAWIEVPGGRLAVEASSTDSDSTALVEALGRGLPGDRLVTDPDVLAAISHDEAEWALAAKAVAGVRGRYAHLIPLYRFLLALVSKPNSILA
jgi:hypothetical protein